MTNDKEQGLALIIVISVLAIVSIMAISFTFTMRLEAKTAFNYHASTQAEYFAQAGLLHAQEVLRQDAQNSLVDHEGEFWKVFFKGADVDNDHNGLNDSAWIDFIDESGAVVGQYAVQIIDELSKININSAGWFPDDPFIKQQGAAPFEVSLEDFFEAESISEPLELARNIVDVRYGGEKGSAKDKAGIDDDADGLVDEEGYPGYDSGDKIHSNDEDRNNTVLSFDRIDNNANGISDEPGEGINEPGEFYAQKPFADDRPFIAPTELKLVKGMDADYEDLAGKLSTFSKSRDIDMQGVARLSLNTATVEEIYRELVDRGVVGSGNLAVNLADYRDTDSARTVLVVDNKETPNPNDTITYYGVESIRINEVMTKPLFTQATENEGAKGDWTWQGDYYRNALPGRGVLGEGVWVWDQIPPGSYKVTFYAPVSGQDIGDVHINGLEVNGVVHGDKIEPAIQIGSDGLLTVTIQNNKEDGSTYFKSVQMSQQPDGEYIELVNLSDKDISVSGWTLEYAPLSTEGWQALVPDAVVPARGYLVLAVDADDIDLEPFDWNPNDDIKNNSISLMTTWPDLDIEHVAELVFQGGMTVTSESDLILDAPSDPMVLVLRDAQGKIVQEVEYAASSVSEYVSIEKGDPAHTFDSDTNGVDDLWYASLGDLGSVWILATPGGANRNDGSLGHMLDERMIKDSPFGSVGELARVAAQGAWSHMSSMDLARVADRLTPFALRLEAEGHLEASGGWIEVLRSPPVTSWYESINPGDEALFSWGGSDRVQNGSYILRVWGQSDESIAISIYQKKESGQWGWSSFTPSLSFQDNHALTYGAVAVGVDQVGSTPFETLRIKVRNDSNSGVAHVDYVTLEPVQSRMGSININTASSEVLSALPGIDLVLAEAIVADRTQKGPYGERTSPALGVGDLLLSPAFVAGQEGSEEEIEAARLERFRLLSNFIEVRSDFFEVISTAQVLRDEQVLAEAKVRVIVER